LHVLAAEDGQEIAPNHLYACPHGVTVSVHAGTLRLHSDANRGNARPPLDQLLASLAEEYGSRAMAVIQEGEESSSAGQRAMLAAGGLVVTLRGTEQVGLADSMDEAADPSLVGLAAKLLGHAAPPLSPLDLHAALQTADLALLVLDADLRIRFFTQATRSIFSLLPTDVGRTLTEFEALAPDPDLLPDAMAVLEGQGARAREIATSDDALYLRRVLPCRLPGNQPPHGQPSGVIVTFLDVSERRVAARALEEATRKADGAAAAKSRFLGTVTHSLRQPLQTLTLLQEMLGKATAGTPAERLAQMLEPPLASMAGMLKAMPAEEADAPAAVAHTGPVMAAAAPR
jgi:PAS domain-containing protein